MSPILISAYISLSSLISLTTTALKTDSENFMNSNAFPIIKYGFIPIKLGPRILRTETAVIAAITALQIKFGDLS